MDAAEADDAEDDAVAPLPLPPLPCMRCGRPPTPVPLIDAALEPEAAAASDDDDAGALSLSRSDEEEEEGSASPADVATEPPPESESAYDSIQNTHKMAQCVNYKSKITKTSVAIREPHNSCHAAQ